MSAELLADPSGDAPTLLLLHGLGATSGVWADVIDALDWPGRIVAPDLAGHGRGPTTGDYTVGAIAAGAVRELANGERVVIAGHSLGGGVGLCLASGFFRPVVVGVVGLGIKVAWTDDDVAGMAKIAEKGVRWFDTRAEAVERFLRQAGLAGIADERHPAVAEAVVERDGQWRVAQDPRTFAQRALDMGALMATARCAVILGAGGNDTMCTAADLAGYTDDARIAPGCGHNVMVENPSWVVALIHEVAGDH